MKRRIQRRLRARTGRVLVGLVAALGLPALLCSMMTPAAQPEAGYPAPKSVLMSWTVVETELPILTPDTIASSALLQSVKADVQAFMGPQVDFSSLFQELQLLYPAPFQVAYTPVQTEYKYVVGLGGSVHCVGVHEERIEIEDSSGDTVQVRWFELVL